MRVRVEFCPTCAAMLRGHAAALGGDDRRAIRDHVHELCAACLGQMPRELADALATRRAVLDTSRCRCP